MMSKQEQETQEFIATGCQYTCQSLIGYSIGLILGIPPLILVSLGKSAMAAAPCGSGSLSYLPEVGGIVYLGELGIVFLLIVGSIFVAKTTRSLVFGLGLGLLTMIIPLLLTDFEGFLSCWK